MIPIIEGHRYELDNLKSSGKTTFTFYMDPELHKGRALEGPSCQEVIRMLIDRLQSLHAEKPHKLNVEIAEHLREALVLFELRAYHMKLLKSKLPECLPTDKDGHVILSDPNFQPKA